MSSSGSKHTCITSVPNQKGMPNILSPATKVGGLIFCSGQVPFDADGKIVSGGIPAMTAQVIRNLEAVLLHAGSSLDKIVKVNIFLKDMDDFAAMNAVYEKLMPTPKPARTCVQAAKLPGDARIEIECIATE